MKSVVGVALFALLTTFTAPALASGKDAGQATASEFDPGKAWKEFEDVFRLYYAYLEQPGNDADEQLANSKQLALQAKNKAAFRKILHQTVLTFADQHLSVGPFDSSDYSITPTGADIEVVYDGTDFTVADVRAGSAADEAGVRPGWNILAADGLPIARAARETFGAVLANPTRKQLEFGAKLAVSGLRNAPRTLVFSAQGKTQNYSLPSTYAFSDELKKRPLVEVSHRGSFAIIRINNALGNNELIDRFDEAIESIGESSGLILDLRNTPSGGNTEVARSIIGHFVREVRPYQVHEIPSLEREFSVPRRFIEMVFPRAPYYSKPLVVLGGYWTGSMGEGLVIGLDAAVDAHIIASDMGDLLGALSNFDLQYSGARLDIGTESLFHVNGIAREDFTADHVVQSADRGPDGSDPVMDHALSYLAQK